MNYDRRYSPPGGGGGYSTQTQARSQQPTPRGIDSRSHFYGREYPPLRSRSQNNIEQDYDRGYPGPQHPQQQPFYDTRTLDKNSRSKSLDTRELRGDDGYYRDDFSHGVIIPIRRETGPRRPFINNPHDSPPRQHQPQQQQHQDDQEIHIPYNHRRSFDDRQRFGGFDSPKSLNSRYPQEQHRPEPRYLDERGIDPNFQQIQPYRSGGGGGGGYRSSSGSHHRSHHETITQQPTELRVGYGPNHGPGYGPGPGPRPIQHRRIQCCCFRFVWPPWSVEPTGPPQQIYRNF